MDTLEAMTTKKGLPLRGAPAQDWFDEEEARTPGFIEKIDAANLRDRIAKDLKALREGAGLTQAQLAEKLGVKQPVVAKIESGKTMPDLMTVHRVAHALGYLVDPPSYRPMPGRKWAPKNAGGDTIDRIISGGIALEDATEKIARKKRPRRLARPSKTEGN
jgi:transcriptional regulator with XRE-family HTH domain